MSGPLISKFSHTDIGLHRLNARQSLNAQGMLTFGTVTETAGARSIGFRIPRRRTADLDTEATGFDTTVSVGITLFTMKQRIRTWSSRPLFP